MPCSRWLALARPFAATAGAGKAINYIVKREHSDGNLKQQSA